MPILPTFIYPFIFAVIAAATGWFMASRSGESQNTVASRVLYAVAAGCVFLGLVFLWLDRT
jgi:lipopolysaccharide biosynthesis regulator YciM